MDEKVPPVSAEWVTASATVGTFVVILTSAIAALVQLRHMRGSNQIVALTECRETLESPEFRAAQRFVSFELPNRLRDPAEAKRVATIPFSGQYEAIATVANFFESMGLFVKNGIIDKDIACDFWAFVIMRNWDALAPVVEYVRRETAPSLWENFEYMAVIASQYNARHPSSYPAGWPRMPKNTSLVDVVEKSSA